MTGNKLAMLTEQLRKSVDVMESSVTIPGFMLTQEGQQMVVLTKRAIAGVETELHNLTHLGIADSDEIVTLKVELARLKKLISWGAITEKKE